MEDTSTNKTPPETASAPTATPKPETSLPVTTLQLDPSLQLHPKPHQSRSRKLFYGVIGALTFIITTSILAAIYLHQSPDNQDSDNSNGTTIAVKSSDEVSQLISRLEIFVSTVENQTMVFKSSRGPQGLILDFFLAIYNRPLRNGQPVREAANEFALKVSPLFEITDRLSQIKTNIATYKKDGTVPPSGELEKNLLTIENLNNALWAWTYQLLATADQELKPRLAAKRGVSSNKAKEIHNVLRQVLSSGSPTNIPSWRDGLNLVTLKSTMENFVSYAKDLEKDELKSGRRS